MGNPRPDLAAEIYRLRETNGWTTIAKSMNARGILTERGYYWSPATVKRYVEPGRSQWAQSMAARRATWRAADWIGR
jgi:hypothetical protein